MNKNNNLLHNLYKESKIWQRHRKILFADIKKIDFKDFRSPGALNNRLASWDPFDKKTYRYYKNILFNIVNSMDDKFIEYYKTIGKTQLGNPIEVIIKGQSFNLDYVFSVQEIIFLSDVLKRTKFIVEIGGGFGRTCHAIINNFSKLQNYTIIDIPVVLEFSKMYLKKVLDVTSYNKIIFLDNDNVDNARGDLYINIDSMQEMDKEVAINYLSHIDRKGSYFYSRNAICKYSPSMIGLVNYDSTEFDNTMYVGLCQNIIDIFNSDDLEAARVLYLEKYRPSNRWDPIKHEISMPWQYYHHVLYAKK